jgi:hypothetical protein
MLLKQLATLSPVIHYNIFFSLFRSIDVVELKTFLVLCRYQNIDNTTLYESELRGAKLASISVYISDNPYDYETFNKYMHALVNGGKLNTFVLV